MIIGWAFSWTVSEEKVFPILARKPQGLVVLKYLTLPELISHPLP